MRESVIISELSESLLDFYLDKTSRQRTETIISR